jgi:Uma2 family endonuclease
MSIAMHEWPRRHRISVQHYYRMAEVGLFAPDERVELIDGEIVDMPPMGTRHAAKLLQLSDILAAAIGDRGMVRAQLPLRLGEDSEPQPDILVVVPRADYYEHQHPTAADTLLAIELSDSTLRFDRDIKAPLYAQHGVPEVWVLDLRANRLIRFRRSAADGELIVTEGHLGMITLDALPGITVNLEPLVTRTPEG